MRQVPEGDRPLSGIKVLDLTRILAGPIAARTLAENGADVLMITAEHLPQVPEHVMDTSHGKRSTFLNLNEAEDVATIRKRRVPRRWMICCGYSAPARRRPSRFCLPSI